MYLEELVGAKLKEKFTENNGRKNSENVGKDYDRNHGNVIMETSK